MDKIEWAAHAAREARDRVVTGESMGLFLQRAHPEAVVDDNGYFLWFDDAADFWGFLRNYLAWLAAGNAYAGDDDAEHVDDAIQPLIDRAERGDGSLMDLAGALSDWLFEFNVDIPWMGMASELLDDEETDFPGQVRNWYRKSRLDESLQLAHEFNASPLSSDDADAFFLSLSSYEGEDPSRP